MKKPWESEKVWLTALGLSTLVGLSALGAISDLSASHVTAIIAALVIGRAWEGAAAAKR